MRQKIATLAVILIACFTAYADYPAFNNTWVNDNADVVSMRTGQTLTADIANLEKTTSVELVVVTVKSLDGRSGPEYAKGIMGAWGVGKKETNNGIVLLLVPSEQKCSMYVGEGVKGTLTRNRAIEIRDAAIDRMKNGSAESAVVGAVHGIMDLFGVQPVANAAASAPNAGAAASRPRYNGPIPVPQPDPSKYDDFTVNLMAYGAFSLFFIVIIVLWLSMSNPYRDELLRHIPELKKLLEEGNGFAKHDDVLRETARAFWDLEKKLKPLTKLTREAKKVDWLQHSMTLDIFTVRSAVRKMEQEIKTAAEAREKVPVLLETMPARIADLRANLAVSKQPQRVASCLDAADAAMLKTEQARSSMGRFLNHLVLYELLRTVEASVSNAAYAHEHAASTSDWTGGVSRSSDTATNNFGFPTVTLGGGSSDNGFGV